MSLLRKSLVKTANGVPPGTPIDSSNDGFYFLNTNSSLDSQNNITKVVTDINPFAIAHQGSNTSLANSSSINVFSSYNGGSSSHHHSGSNNYAVMGDSNCDSSAQFSDWTLNVTINANHSHHGIVSTSVFWNYYNSVELYLYQITYDSSTPSNNFLPKNTIFLIDDLSISIPNSVLYEPGYRAIGRNVAKNNGEDPNNKLNNLKILGGFYAASAESYHSHNRTVSHTDKGYYDSDCSENVINYNHVSSTVYASYGSHAHSWTANSDGVIDLSTIVVAAMITTSPVGLFNGMIFFNKSETSTKPNGFEDSSFYYNDSTNDYIMIFGDNSNLGTTKVTSLDTNRFGETSTGSSSTINMGNVINHSHSVTSGRGISGGVSQGVLYSTNSSGSVVNGTTNTSHSHTIYKNYLTSSNTHLLRPIKYTGG